MTREQIPWAALRAAAPPELDEAARETAVTAALAAYAEAGDERQASVQGLPSPTRPEKTGTFSGLLTMITTALDPVTHRWPGRGAAVLSACLVAFAAVLLWPRPDSAPEPPPALTPERGLAMEDAAAELAAPAAATMPSQLPTPIPSPNAAPPSADLAKRELVMGRARTPSEALARRRGPLAEASAPGPTADSRMPLIGPAPRDANRFPATAPSGVLRTAAVPVSTFAVDVDTAAYSFVRRQLEGGVLPPPAAVRVEELINYFDYDYPVPAAGEAPFSTTVALYPTPWNPDTRLLHIGLQGYTPPLEARPFVNLVFLVDTSGSMQGPDRLPLLVTSLRMLVRTLRPEDRVAIVSYAGSAGTVLEPTPAADKDAIDAALTALAAGGSTAGGAGLRQAYALARSHAVDGRVSRVVLATDGDFNVGMTDLGQLEGTIAREREAGIYLSVLGFGDGNYNDALMQTLAQHGNGVAAYIDSLAEARKVLVEEATANLLPIADDVKVQVEFNPATVVAYRLVGYESRALEREDFNDDAVDAGEIGAGHRVTALYEIVPVGSPAAAVDPLRYADAVPQVPRGPHANEYAWLRLRYKAPGADASQLLEQPVTTAQERSDLAALGPDFRFAAAVAAFGQKLRGDRALRAYDWTALEALAAAAVAEDDSGRRREFVQLVRLAAGLQAMER